MQMNRRQFFAQRLPLWQNDIALFAWENFRYTPDPWQAEVFHDVEQNPKVSVRSGQGVGKTSCEAVIGLWFLSCFPNARVVATAPTKHQLNDVLWSEIAKWQAKSSLLSSILKWTKTYIYVRGHEERWFAVARTATKPENMQGFHEDYMLFIVDEASGVAEPIMEAVLGTLSGKNNKLLLCGNPTQTTGTFYDSHTRDRAIYRTHKVSSWDSPRTNKENLQALERKYGKGSNFCRVRIEGDFPTAEDDVFIPIALVERSVRNKIEVAPRPARIAFGVDVARFGDDKTVIGKNVDGQITISAKRFGQDLMKTVGDIVVCYRQSLKDYPRYRGKIYAIIDDTGLGGGVTDRLREVKREQKLDRLEIVPVNFAQAPDDEEGKKYYADIATYMWATVRDGMAKDEIQLPNDDDTMAQFSCRKYTLTSSGKIKLEGKNDLKKRGLPSPDHADAVALSCYQKKQFDLTYLT